MNRFFRFIYRLLNCFIFLFHPVTVSGLENLPRHGVILCPNHASNWDPILLTLKLPIDYHLYIMGKAQLFQNPLLGWVLRKVGVFPVSRGNSDIQSVKTALQTIKNGDNLLIFPEGTRIRNGIGSDGKPASAKSGAAMIGVRAGAALVPVFLDREKRVFHRTRIIFGKPYHPVYSGRHGTAEEMQKIADEIMKAAYALGGDTE